MKVKNICCIGAGYVGGPTMAVLALKSPNIKFHVVDINQKRIDQWNGSLENLPIFEPGLSEIVGEIRNKNLFFSSNVEDAIKKSEIIFISVNTPTKTKGIGKDMAADLKYVEKCARLVGEVSENNKIIVEKSTLPVRTAETIKNILLSSNSKFKFEILSNPEFLAEGTAIHNMLFPDRVLIGSDQTKSGLEASKTLFDIYRSWIPEEKILLTNVWSSELSKLVANAFLAQRVSSINSISALCEKTEANIDEISKAIGADSRIGSKFLKSSVGFGGSCFQKDILNLVYIAQHYGLTEVAEYWLQVVKINNYQKDRFSRLILENMFNTIEDKVITLFGWAFKKDTNDTRESASIQVAYNLLENGAILKVHDPMVNEDQIKLDISNLCKKNNFSKSKIELFISRITFFKQYKKSVIDSHSIAILTEWDIFLDYDWKFIYSKMIKPSYIFDGRNILNKVLLSEVGFKVVQIGKFNDKISNHL